LDPFERHIDQELWKALEKCDIKGMVSGDKPVDECVTNELNLVLISSAIACTTLFIS